MLTKYARIYQGVKVRGGYPSELLTIGSVGDFTLLSLIRYGKTPRLERDYLLAFEKEFMDKDGGILEIFDRDYENLTSLSLDFALAFSKEAILIAFSLDTKGIITNAFIAREENRTIPKHETNHYDDLVSISMQFLCKRKKELHLG